MQDLEEIRKITGVCPQCNVHFDILTVKENLRLFAKIKGIRPLEVEQEVNQPDYRVKFAKFNHDHRIPLRDLPILSGIKFRQRGPIKKHIYIYYRHGQLKWYIHHLGF